VDAEDELMACRFQLAEMLGNPVNLRNIDATARSVPGLLITDSRNVYDKLQNTMLTLKGAEKRSDLEALCLKEALNECGVNIRWVNGESQLANSLTKADEPQQLDLFRRMGLRWKIIYDPEMLSGRKRRQAGLGALDNIAPNRNVTNETKSTITSSSPGESDVPDNQGHQLGEIKGTVHETCKPGLQVGT